MNQIKFSQEWDKLKPENRIVGELLTTARAYDARKQVYYESKLCEGFDVMLKGKRIGMAKLLTVDYHWTADIDISFWKDDTYSNITYPEIQTMMKGFYGNTNPFLMVLTFKWVEVEA
jgi:hypothetical protein